MTEAMPRAMTDGGAGCDVPSPLSSHLADLRKSVIVSAAAVLLCSVLAYRYVDPVLRDVARPVGKLYFLSPAEAFMTKLKFSVVLGAMMSAPCVFFSAWSFIHRGLLPRERKAVFLLTAVSLALSAAGALFCYTLVLPASVRFLMGYGSDMLVPFISVTRYLSFAGRMVLSFAAAFQLPLAMWFLVRAGLIRSSVLRRNRRLAVVLVFLSAAVLTPTTDVFNQVLMAGPLLVLYEAGLIAARLSERKRGRITWEG